jgi:uncharacterized protein (TIGR02246 family)
MSTTSPNGAVTPTAAAISEIEKVLAALPESWNRHDMVAYASYFTDDADFINILGMHWRGRAAIEAQHINIHKTIFRNSQLQALNHTIRFLAPGVAVAHVNWEMTGHEIGPSKEWQPAAVRKGVLTAVLVPDGETWRITALHNTDTVSVQAVGIPPAGK